MKYFILFITLLTLTYSSNASDQKPLWQTHSINGEAVEYSPDGTMLAFSGHSTVTVLDANSQKILHRFEGHLGNVTALEWSPDSKYLISGSKDYSNKTTSEVNLLVWDVENGNVYKELTPVFENLAEITSIAWNKYDDNVIISGDDGFIYIYMDIFKNPKIIKRDGYYASKIIAGKSGKFIELSSSNVLSIVDYLNTSTEPISNVILDFDLSEDSDNLCYLKAYNEVFIYRISLNDTVPINVGELEKGEYINKVTLADNGTKIITFSDLGNLRIDGVIIEKLELAAYNDCKVSFNQTNDNIAVVTTSNELINYDTKKEEYVSKYKGINDQVLNINWSQSNNIIYIAEKSYQNKYIVFDTDSSYLNDYGLSNSFCIKHNNKDDRIAFGQEDGTLEIFDSDNSKFNSPITAHKNRIWNVDWSPDDSYLVTCSADSTAKIYETTNWNEEKILIGHTYGLRDVQWSPNGKYIATASEDETIIIWDAVTWDSLRALTEHSSYVNSVRWNSDGTKLASCSGDGTMKIWDSSTWNLISNPSVSEGLWECTWSPDDKFIAFGGTHKGETFIWDVSNGKITDTLDSHTDDITSLDWSSDGTKLATCSDDRTIAIWDMTKIGTHSLSGRITENGANLANIKVVIGAEEIHTKIDGTYTLGNVPSGPITITPQSDDYTFNPSNRQFNVEDNTYNLDFEATKVINTIDISGTIEQEGEPRVGIKVYLQNHLKDSIGFTTTDEFGKYEFKNRPIPNPNYIIQPVNPDYSFDPPNHSVKESDPNYTSYDFNVDFKKKYKVTGVVTDSKTESPIPGIRVDLHLDSNQVKGRKVAFDDTGDTGAYQMDTLANGEYIIDIENDDYTYSPDLPFRFTINEKDTIINIIATKIIKEYNISGTVMDTNGDGVDDVTVIIENVDTTQTLNGGKYSFENIDAQEITMRTYKEGCTRDTLKFNLDDDVIEKDFIIDCTVPTYSLGGTIVDDIGKPIENVKVEIVPLQPKLTDDLGKYQFPAINQGEVTVSVSKKGYTFAENTKVIDLLEDTDTLNFEGIRNIYYIEGTISGDNLEMSGVTVSLTHPDNDYSKTISPNETTGYYKFDSIPEETVIISTHYNDTECTLPIDSNIVLMDNVTGIDFDISCPTKDKIIKPVTVELAPKEGLEKEQSSTAIFDLIVTDIGDAVLNNSVKWEAEITLDSRIATNAFFITKGIDSKQITFEGQDFKTGKFFSKAIINGTYDKDTLGTLAFIVALAEIDKFQLKYDNFKWITTDETDSIVTNPVSPLTFRVISPLKDGTIVYNRVSGIEVVNIFPQPTSSELSIDMEGKGDLEIVLTNQVGKTISIPYKGRISGKESIQLNLSSIESGYYYLHFKSGSDFLIKEIIIVK